MFNSADVDQALVRMTPDTPLELFFYPLADHPLSDRLQAMTTQLVGLGGGRVVVRPGVGDPLPAVPCLVVSYGGRRQIRYLAAPEGSEVMPFLEAIAKIALKLETLEVWQAELLEVTEPLDLMVFIAAACAHCPHMVKAANSLTLVNKRITTTIVDAQYFPGLAQQFGARSVPLTVVNGGLSISGTLRAPELAARLLSRGTVRYAKEELASMVASGRFKEVAGRMCAGTALAPFVNAWRVSGLSERMGLMLAAEHALAEDPGALDPVVTDLIAVLTAATSDAALRGDTADLLGQTGSREAVAPLQTLRVDDNPDVREIVEEAIAAIKDAGRG